MPAFLVYDRESCRNVPTTDWCWRCLDRSIVERTIRAHLLTEEGVSSRLVRWRQCFTCGKQSKAESELP